MDRAIVYAGSIPLDTDVLRAGRYGKQAVGALADMVFGSGVAAASGLACTVSSGALSVTIGPGSITAGGVMDATAIGGAGGGYAADSTAVTCQYVNAATVTVAIPGAGATYTIYALCSEQDTDQTVLPFYNASNPGQTQAGEDNDGALLPTRRQAALSFTAATSAPPAPDGGSVVALYTLAVPQGATSLSGVTPQAGSVFWPTIPELATLTLLKSATEPPTLVTADGTIPIPAWASRVELRAIGGGGGGSSTNAQNTSGDFSGGGGGAGGDAWGVYDVNPNDSATLTATIGGGGGSQGGGGTTSVTYGGSTLISANGGSPGNFYANAGSAGGTGGSASGGTKWNLTGGFGGDGQSGTATFGGNGASGPFGGGGRAGNTGGMDATAFGAGGGGSYSAATAGTSVVGGSGYQGCVLYRFLP